MRAMLLHPIRFWRDHRFAMAHASAFLDGELPAADARRIDRHAGACPKCHEMLETLRGVLRGLRSMPAPARPSVVPGVLEALRRDDVDDNGHPS